MERIYGVFMVAIALTSLQSRVVSFTKLTGFLLLFVLSVTLSCLFGWDPQREWDGLYRFLTVVVFIVVLYASIRNKYDLFVFFSAYLAIMWIYLAKSQYEFFVHGAAAYGMGVSRLGGISVTYGHPNALAASVVLSLPWLIFVWTQRKTFSSQWRSSCRKLLSLLLASYAWLALSSIVLTNSRTGMAAFVLFCLMAALRFRGFIKKTGVILLTVLCLLLGWGVMDQSHKNRFRTLWDESAGPENAEQSAEGRWRGFLAGLEAVRRFPFFGTGPESFVSYRAMHIDGSPKQTHNLVGEVLGKTGFVGTFTFGCLVCTALLAARRLRRSALISVHRDASFFTDVGRGCRDNLLLLLFLGLGGHNLFRPHWLWMAAFLEIASALNRNESESLQINTLAAMP